MRTYNFNPDDLHHLFAKIIHSLSIHDATENVVGSILSEVCEHFKFGCGFVYEADYTNTFFLKERYASYDTANLSQSFQLEKHLDVEEIRVLLGKAAFFQQIDPGDAEKGKTRIFESNTIILVPAIGREQKPIGLVGMMDRRRNILLDEKAIESAKMVLNLIANNVKIRIYQQNLKYSRQALMGILDNTGIDIYVNDFYTHEILYVNKSMAAPYGGWKNMMGKKCWQAIYTDKTGQCEYCPQKKLIDEHGNPTKIYSWDYQRPFDGAWFRVLSAVFRWVDGRLAHVVSSVDITENKNNEALIAKMANYDALTNLPNRRKLFEDCRRAILAAEDGGEGFLLFFDLDNFKTLNDNMGHQAGDELLIEVGKMLQSHPLTCDRCYRYGGDEFILLYQNVDKGYIVEVCKYLLNRFEQPWQLRNASPTCKASIGVAEYPIQGKNPDDLLHSADLLMYKAKENGGGMACFYDGGTIRPDKASSPTTPTCEEHDE